MEDKPVVERKDQKARRKRQAEQRRSTSSEVCTFPSEEERFPVHIPGAYQVATGTRKEIVSWLEGIPRNTQVILVSFSNEADYNRYGPIFCHVAHKLPEIARRVQRRRFERLVAALTQLSLDSQSDLGTSE